MANYIPALIWTIGAIVCIPIARKRRVRITPLRSVIGALLGPLAIPLILILKADVPPPASNR